MSFFNRFNRNYNDIDQSTKYSLDDFINRSDNKGKCCECLSPSVKFISITFKCLLCSRCGNAHIDNMPKSVVKSTVYKESWNRQDFKTLKSSGGNRENYKIYNAKNQPFPYDGDIDKVEVDNYIKEKYIYGSYMNKVKEKLLYNKLCDDDEIEKSAPTLKSSRSYTNLKNKDKNKPSLPSKPRPDTKNFNPSQAVFTGEDQFNSQSNTYTSMFEPQFTSQPKPAVFDGSFDYQPVYTNNGQSYIQPEAMEKVREQQFYQQQVMNQPSHQHQEIMNMYSQPGVYQSGVEIGPNNPQYQEILNQQQLIQQHQYHQHQMQQQQQMMLQQQMYQQNQLNNSNGFY